MGTAQESDRYQKIALLIWGPGILINFRVVVWAWNLGHWSADQFTSEAVPAASFKGIGCATIPVLLTQGMLRGRWSALVQVGQARPKRASPRRQISLLPESLKVVLGGLSTNPVVPGQLREPLGKLCRACLFCGADLSYRKSRGALDSGLVVCGFNHFWWRINGKPNHHSEPPMSSTANHCFLVAARRGVWTAKVVGRCW